MTARMRVRSYEDGGTMQAGSPFQSLFDPIKYAFALNQAVQPVTNSAYPGLDPKALQLSNQGNYLNSQLAQIGPSQNYLNAMAGVYGAQGNVIPARQNQINALGSVYSAQQGVFGPQQQYINAQGQVINAQGQETQGQQQYIGAQQQNNQMTLAEQQALQAAEQNIPDLTATAQAQYERNSDNYKFGMAGLPVPEEIDTQGKPLPGGLGPNVRAKLSTQAEIVGKKAQDAEKIRGLQLEGARLAVQLLGTNVDLARQAAARVGLTVDQAQLLVDQARNQANIAGLGVDQANLGVSQAENAADYARLGQEQAALNTKQLGIQNDISELPPKSGLTTYTNPFTGASQYLTPAQAEIQQRADTGVLGAISPSGSGGATTAGISIPGATPAQLQEGASLKKLSPTFIARLYFDGQLDKNAALAALVGKGYSLTAASTYIDNEFRRLNEAESKKNGGSGSGPAITFGGNE